MASLCGKQCLLVLVLVISTCSFSLAAPFHSIYSFGDSSSSSAADHVSAALLLPAPQPFTQQGAEFESGLSFASLSFATPGATIMSPFFFLKNGIRPPPQSHDPSQIVSFMKTFYKDCSSFHDCGRNNRVLRNALVFMDQPGINDYKQAFLQGKSIAEASHLVPEVVETIKHSVERLIKEAGAKTIMVSASLPTGCFPGYQAMFPQDKSKSICRKGLNMFSKLHNDHLWQATQDLRLKYPDVHIMYADYYRAFMAILKNHEFLGFKTNTLMKACSDNEDAAACTHRASHLLWDGFQLTPQALENLIDTLFSKKGFVFPELELGEVPAAAVKGQIHARVRDMSSVIRRLLFI